MHVHAYVYVYVGVEVCVHGRVYVILPYLTLRYVTLRITYFTCWAEARIKIARMPLTIKLDGNWNSFQLANSAPPLSVTDSAVAPSARMLQQALPDVAQKPPA